MVVLLLLGISQETRPCRLTSSVCVYNHKCHANGAHRLLWQPELVFEPIEFVSGHLFAPRNVLVLFPVELEPVLDADIG